LHKIMTPDLEIRIRLSYMNIEYVFITHIFLKVSSKINLYSKMGSKTAFENMYRCYT